MKAWFERVKWILVGVLTLAFVAGLAVFLVRLPRSQPPIMSLETPPPTPEPTATPKPLRVYVSGAVQKPDVYALPPGSIVKDAILAAGGASAEADLEAINLAQPVADGQQVHVPRRGEGSTPVPLKAQPVGATGTAGPVNINTADLVTLDTLPGIGPVTAQRIIDYRETHGPFARVEEIMEVEGIGQATFDKIRELIRTK